ncbi:MAG: DUF5007 domain-containing protein [Sphingobacterium sp.]|uniref:DUF5007 domain-containing protein n=1 Tax=unclassified Sphingobacterium TaxID=2609468 RepID=UPI002844BC6E|nr:DUF5007 domain-containing protein [Sphingobacterium sp.]MDR3006613.1 DUF5007 domain-containing protein [Sphingobacterium sp.]
MKISRSYRTIYSGTYRLGLLALLCMGLNGCKKIYNLPDEKDFLSVNLTYDGKSFYPVLGRTSRMGTVNTDHSTTPLHFEIVNPRYGDGRPYTDLFQVKPVYEWISRYDGTEKNLEEIEAKRKIVDRPLFEVDSTGTFILWNSSTNELIEPRSKDSVDLVQNIRYFDLKISNSGGSTIVKDFMILPWRVQDYEPYSDRNPYDGEIAPDPKDPKNPNKKSYIWPSYIANVNGESSNLPLRTNDDFKDLVVYIRRFTGGNGNNLRFVFLDKDGKTINPENFNETKWNELVHGFNMKKTADYVQYDVAYPIPLTSYPTKYTNGNSAKLDFSYSRKGFGGGLITASFGLNFRIFTKGDWEIVFHFQRENPRFENE